MSFLPPQLVVPSVYLSSYIKLCRRLLPPLFFPLLSILQLPTARSCRPLYKHFLARSIYLPVLELYGSLCFTQGHEAQTRETLFTLPWSRPELSMAKLVMLPSMKWFLWDCTEPIGQELQAFEKLNRFVHN